jgi:hypothetical protein
MRLADDAREFPDERYDRVPGAREAFHDAPAVEEFEARGFFDLGCRLLRDDAQFGLRLGERRLDIEPGLPAVLLPVQRADAGIGDARRRR